MSPSIWKYLGTDLKIPLGCRGDNGNQRQVTFSRRLQSCEEKTQTWDSQSSDSQAWWGTPLVATAKHDWCVCHFAVSKEQLCADTLSTVVKHPRVGSWGTWDVIPSPALRFIYGETLTQVFKHSLCIFHHLKAHLRQWDLLHRHWGCWGAKGFKKGAPKTMELGPTLCSPFFTTWPCHSNNCNFRNTWLKSVDVLCK